MYFLGKLGVILRRAANGEWTLDAVDTNLDLTSMAENARGDRVVGGSEGRVFFKRSGSDWVDVSIGHHFDIERLAFQDEDTIEMIARDIQKLYVYRGSLNEAELSWQELNHFSNEQRWTNSPPADESQARARSSAKRIVRTEFQEVDGQHYISIYMMRLSGNPLFGQGSPVHYRYAPETWQPVQIVGNELPDVPRTVPAGHSKIGIELPGFWSWTTLPKYSRYVESRDSWETMNTYVFRCNGQISEDATCGNDGNTNKPVASKKDTFSFLSVPWFVNENEAVAVARFSSRDWWSGQEDTEVLMLKTNDGGLTWVDSERSLPKEYCVSFVPEISDRLVLSCSVSGDFFESTDVGESWQHVRQHESF